MKSIGYILLSLVSGFFGAFLFFQTSDSSKEAISVSNADTGKLQMVHFPEAAPVSNRYSVNQMTDFVEASALANPSVVYLKTISKGQAQMDWFSYWFYGGGREQQVINSGSGVIFSKDGYIVTNNHVVDGATQIQVIHNRRVLDATVVGKDPSTDLALLKVEANDLPPIKIGSSKSVNVGEWVLAVGNPFNLTSTVTAGIVSAKGRSINVVNSQFPIESFIQTDAAINPGNSGGALVNTKGELIGINTAILSRTGSYTGYGFAVPVDIVVKVVNDLIKYGEIQKAFLDADVLEFDSKEAEKRGIKTLEGILLSAVKENGAADKSGIKKDAILLEIEGNKINSKAEFDEQLSYYRPGDKIKLKIAQGSMIEEKSITLNNRIGTTTMLKRRIIPGGNTGADFEELSDEEKKSLGIKSGVRVMNIRGGILARLGQMDNGSIIMSINKVEVNDAQTLIGILENLKGKVNIQGRDSRGRMLEYTFFW